MHAYFVFSHFCLLAFLRHACKSAFFSFLLARFFEACMQISYFLFFACFLPSKHACKFPFFSFLLASLLKTCMQICHFLIFVCFTLKCMHANLHFSHFCLLHSQMYAYKSAIFHFLLALPPKFLDFRQGKSLNPSPPLKKVREPRSRTSLLHIQIPFTRNSSMGCSYPGISTTKPPQSLYPIFL